LSAFWTSAAKNVEVIKRRAVRAVDERKYHLD
jgi:hypothetical protein